MGLNWDDASLLKTRRVYEPSDGWHWDGNQNAEGLLWGGCVESIDEMLRHNAPIPTLEQFATIVLMLETSEEIPTAEYVFRVMRALGERGILARIQGVLVGRAKAWEFDKQRTSEEKEAYRIKQREIILKAIRAYNADVPIVQNLNFGHTDPQIPMPYGNNVRIDIQNKRMWARF